MGIFKDIVKKVALAAAVVAGKRILSKVVTDVIDTDNKSTSSETTNKPKPASTRRRKPAKAKTVQTESSAVKPQGASKPRTTTSSQTKKSTNAKPKASETTSKPKATRKPRSSTAQKNSKPPEAGVSNPAQTDSVDVNAESN